MKKMRNWWIGLLLFTGTSIFACSNNEDEPVFPAETEETYDMTGFARGADVSWLTEMEAEGRKFYDIEGDERECLSLLRELGMNAIRLRVWVNPAEKWCNQADVIAKAWRAHNLGYRLMIDFHYSDTWADPGNQTKPVAWTEYSFEELRQAVAAHTAEVLTALKNQGIEVEWVQVGNETSDGMLWEEGRASADMEHFAALVTSGYDAVKSVFPEAQVIVHLDRGNELTHFTWMFDGLREHGAKWDVIGMSLYPGRDDENGWQELDANGDTWQQQNDDCIANMRTLIERYDTPVMMCEIGIPWNYEGAETFYTDFITKAKQVDGCLGVFAWEPQCYGSWKNYHKGMFNDQGHPMPSLNAFKRE